MTSEIWAVFGILLFMVYWLSLEYSKKETELQKRLTQLENEVAQIKIMLLRQ
jgi:hypothetical protein